MACLGSLHCSIQFALWSVLLWGSHVALPRSQGFVWVSVCLCLFIYSSCALPSQKKQVCYFSTRIHAKPCLQF